MKIIDTQSVPLKIVSSGQGGGGVQLPTLFHGHGYYFILTFVPSLRAESALYDRTRGAFEYLAVGRRDVSVGPDV